MEWDVAKDDTQHDTNEDRLPGRVFRVSFSSLPIECVIRLIPSSGPTTLMVSPSCQEYVAIGHHIDTGAVDTCQRNIRWWEFIDITQALMCDVLTGDHDMPRYEFAARFILRFMALSEPMSSLHCSSCFLESEDEQYVFSSITVSGVG